MSESDEDEELSRLDDVVDALERIEEAIKDQRESSTEDVNRYLKRRNRVLPD